jgi:hypothetical protein
VQSYHTPADPGKFIFCQSESNNGRMKLRRMSTTSRNAMKYQRKRIEGGLDGGKNRSRFAQCSKSVHRPSLACSSACFLMTPTRYTKHESCDVIGLQNAMLSNWRAH